jgi:Ni,Fe-hydrogenase maturation factor
MDTNIMEMVVISTHSLSLRMLGQYLAMRTDARVSVLAIQPEVIDMGEGLSDPVARSVHAMSVLLSDLLSNSEPASS